MAKRPVDDFHFQSNRESHVEDELIRWAQKNGWMARLMTYRGRRGCPDALFAGHGKLVLIEFKKPKDGHLSGNQVRERRRYEDHGVTVFVIDDLREGIAALKRMAEEC